MKIAFLIPKVLLAGGIFIVLEHASRLSKEHGHDVTLVLTHSETIEHDYPNLSSLHLVGVDDVGAERFDVALATWWDTAYYLPRVEAELYAHFVQSLEDRFYRPYEAAARVRAGAIQSFPIPRIVTAGWLQQHFRSLMPGIPAECVVSGVDKTVFAGEPPTFAAPDEPLKVVVEGPPDVWFKAVPEAVEAIGDMAEPHELTLVTGPSPCPPELAARAKRVEKGISHRQMANVFRDSHVLLKLSRVEGMAAPPLEAFHMGATAILAPMTGHDEYVVDGHNALVVGFDDVPGTTRSLDLLARDRELLHTLRTNAHDTALRWPDWSTATAGMAAALERLVENPATLRAENVRQLILETDANLSSNYHADTLRAERDALRATLTMITMSRGWLMLERLRRILRRRPRSAVGR